MLHWGLWPHIGEFSLLRGSGFWWQLILSSAIHRSAGPANFDPVHVRLGSQAKVQSRVLRGLIAHASLAFVVSNHAVRRHLHFCSYSITIGTDADQENLKPMVRGVAFVSEQLGPPSVIADENIQVSVVIVVPDGCAPADAGNGKVRAKLVAYVLENAMTPI